MEWTNSQTYEKQVQGINKDLLVKKIYDTIVCNLMLYYMK